MADVNVLVLRTAGTNCDREAIYAFASAGGKVQPVHINRVLGNPKLLKDFQILVLPGGFSYGDDIAAGKILANQLLHHLADQLREFVDAGKLIIGICNGFQVLVKTGLLPGDLGKDLPAGGNGQIFTHPFGTVRRAYYVQFLDSEVTGHEEICVVSIVINCNLRDSSCPTCL